MCDLLLFFYFIFFKFFKFLGIASTQDEFVLFDKIAQNRSSFLLLFVKKNCTSSINHINKKK